MVITCLLAPHEAADITGDDGPAHDPDGQQSARRDGHHQARSATRVHLGHICDESEGPEFENSRSYGNDIAKSSSLKICSIRRCDFPLGRDLST
jgi:hypothetical protein